MHNLVTVTDIDYLPKALTLYESLCNTQKSEFKLHIVCLDKKTYQIVEKIQSKNIEPIKIEDIEDDNFEIKAIRYAEPSREAVSNASAQGKDPKYVQFCWAMASYSCWYLVSRRKLDHVFYLDADLFFYNSIDDILSEIGKKSVGIVRHRIDYLPDSGEFNVGLVYFKNDYIGHRCCDWWKRMLLDPGNPFSAGYGQCGDQKYLELFTAIFGTDNVCIIDKDIGHLAPWSATFHKYKDEKLVWENRTQPLYFFHFAHFVPDFKKDSYKTSYNNEWIWGEPEKSDPFVLKLYNDYYNQTKKTIQKYMENQ